VDPYQGSPWTDYWFCGWVFSFQKVTSVANIHRLWHLRWHWRAGGTSFCLQPYHMNADRDPWASKLDRATCYVSTMSFENGMGRFTWVVHFTNLEKPIYAATPGPLPASMTTLLRLPADNILWYYSTRCARSYARERYTGLFVLLSLIIGSTVDVVSRLSSGWRVESWAAIIVSALDRAAGCRNNLLGAFLILAFIVLLDIWQAAYFHRASANALISVYAGDYRAPVHLFLL